MALARLRQGRFAEVEPWCASSLASDLRPDDRATVLATIAMARRALGQPYEEPLAEAVALSPHACKNTGAYHASKWALECFSQSLAQEVADFGVRVTLIEPPATRPTGPGHQPAISSGVSAAIASMTGSRPGRAVMILTMASSSPALSRSNAAGAAAAGP